MIKDINFVIRYYALEKDLGLAEQSDVPRVMWLHDIKFLSGENYPLLDEYEYHLYRYTYL